MKRKIAIITTTRADFGLLRFLMTKIANDTDLTLQTLATGTHLSKKHGLTKHEITKAGLIIHEEIFMDLDDDRPLALSKSVGIGLMGFAEAYDRLKPDIIVVLGDRFELISAVTPAFMANIPIAHLHGGEITGGAFDDSIRHAISKMSHLHFVAHDDYKARLCQLGEQPERIFTVGGMGVDALGHLQFLCKDELEKSLDFTFLKRNLLITHHPVTVELGKARQELKALLHALDELKETGLIFTMPNADPDSDALALMIKNFAKDKAHVKCFASMGQLNYLSTMRVSDAVVGNSSSGICEAPSFHIGTINIGDRQQGRLSASSVIHCTGDYQEIKQAIHKLYSHEFQDKIKQTINPYGQGNASTQIHEILKSHPLEELIKKRFHDL